MSAYSPFERMMPPSEPKNTTFEFVGEMAIAC